MTQISRTRKTPMYASPTPCVHTGVRGSLFVSSELVVAMYINMRHRTSNQVAENQIGRLGAGPPGFPVELELIMVATRSSHFYNWRDDSGAGNENSLASYRAPTRGGAAAVHDGAGLW
jgi:hypothetical protein